MFQNSTFPELKLIHGLQRSYILPTTIVTNGASEYRLNRLSSYRIRWRWPARLIRAEDRKAMATFYTETAKGGLYSFKFKDPDNFSFNATPLVYSGSSNRFFLRSPLDTHPIFHLDANVQVLNGSTPVAFTKEVVNGVPYINAPTFTSGLTITGTFYYAARFDQGNLDWVMAALNTSNASVADEVADITLLEVFEH